MPNTHVPITATNLPIASLNDVSDDLGIVRNLLECAFMATHALHREQGHPLATLIHEVRERVDEAEAKLEALRQGGDA